MHVVATAGHVDHGKSTLVRALTGMEPDRLAEERRRGMTIDLGFAWATLPSGADIAFVDVPGHERFVPTMLAGAGPVPAVVFVVAADAGWQAQSEEHLAALDAWGVRHALLVVSKCDLADPGRAVDEARTRLARSSLGPVEAVEVSAATGAGMVELARALDRLVLRLPEPDRDAAVRLWVDRAFTIHGAGTVVTGTLAAGCIRVGDELELTPAGETVTVRGLESMRLRLESVAAVARVAVNLRGVERASVRRGMALLTPRAWRLTEEVDVVLSAPVGARDVVSHVGAAAVPTRVRPMSARAARLRFSEPLPLHAGDRMLLRDPSRHVVVARADVADVDPVPLHRRGDAARVARSLRLPVTADDVVDRHGVVHEAALRRAGVTASPTSAHRAGAWWVAPSLWSSWSGRLLDLVGCGADPLPEGLSLEEVRHALALPDAGVAAAVSSAVAGVTVAGGRVRAADAVPSTPPQLAWLVERLADAPLELPAAATLEEHGIDQRVLAIGARRGLLLHLGGGVYVGADAPAWALRRLASLEEPFSVSAARVALGSTRRVVVPLLEHLDATRRTRKAPDGTRFLVPRQG